MLIYMRNEITFDAMPRAFVTFVWNSELLIQMYNKTITKLIKHDVQLISWFINVDVRLSKKITFNNLMVKKELSAETIVFNIRNLK